jgi:phosphate starvation-inducible PhoH-like protein
VREFDLAPSDNTRLAKLCGPLDENLHLIEDHLGVSVKRRGANFRIVGQRAHAAEPGARPVRCRQPRESLARACALALRDSRDTPGALDAEGDRGRRGRARGARHHLRGRHQRDLLASIHAKDLTFGIGPAGTGKTYLAVACAVEALQADRIRRIIW